MECVARSGLVSALDTDADLVKRLLTTMQEAEADFTLTFRRLAVAASDPALEPTLLEMFADPSGIGTWLRDWRDRLTHDAQRPDERMSSMRRVNPAFIPRNHRVEAALNAATQGDLGPFGRLLAIVQRPYDDQPEAAEYSLPPQPQERVRATFCGT